MTAPANAVALAREHRRLERLMQRHQRALVDARFDWAAQRWRRYRERLAAHIEVEESWLAEAETQGWPLRWPVRVYRLEHRRILELAAAVAHELEAAPRARTADFRIALIEREKTLKGVLEHHHAREEQDLYRHFAKPPAR
ncbi:MAG: hemerythrin domain-containing protein [Gammaproteobacteria bacterium]|nr:hemerythrin domain-containing protein [Gammaproteobacteria bacterium]